MMNMALILPIAAGGAIGAVGRYLMGATMLRYAGAGIPYGTLAVNVLGSLLIGLLAGYFMREGVEVKPTMQAFLITGILGGFTTFSAFSLETVTLLQRGDMLAALAYVTASLLLCVLACGIGFAVIK